MKRGSGRWYVLFLIFLLCLMSFKALAEDDATGDSGLYGTAGVSFFVIELPEYAPLWNRVSMHTGDRLTTFGGSVSAPMEEISLGWQGDGPWFVELRGHFASTDTEEAHDFRPPAGYTSVGFYPLAGEYAGSGTPGTAMTRTELSFKQFGGSLVAGRSFSVDGIGVDLFAGYWFMEMDQHYDFINITTGGTHLIQSDEADTTYHGLLAGLRMDWNIGWLGLGLETTHGLAYARADYHGEQENVTLWVSSMDQGEHSVAYRGVLESSLSTEIWQNMDLALTLGVQYLTYVPQIMASGQGGGPPIYGPDTVAHIQGRGAFSRKLGVEFGYSF